MHALGIIIFIGVIALGLWRVWRFYTADATSTKPTNAPDLRNFAPPASAGRDQDASDAGERS